MSVGGAAPPAYSVATRGLLFRCVYAFLRKHLEKKKKKKLPVPSSRGGEEGGENVG